MKHVEVWRPILGYEQRYEVSDAGNVRSLNFWDGRRNVTGKMLSPGSTKSGHVTVSLGRHNSKTVHSLVLLAFVGPRPDGNDVLHINHVPWDNRLANLRYGTRSENLKMDYAVGVKRLPWGSGTAHPKAKFTDSAIRLIRTSTLSLAELGRIYGVCYQTIGAIRSGRTWSHVI